MMAKEPVRAHHLRLGERKAGVWTMERWLNQGLVTRTRKLSGGRPFEMHELTEKGRSLYAAFLAQIAEERREEEKGETMEETND